MTIGINGFEANVAHRVGVGQYARELLGALERFRSEELRFTNYLPTEPLPGMPAPSEYWQYEVFGPQKLWTLVGLQTRLIEEKMTGRLPDVFFTPTHYTPLYMPLPSVIAIMDMSFERFPEYFKKKDLYQLKYWTSLSARQAKKIVTISEFSKAQICKIYGFAKEKVVVTYPGYDEKRFNLKVKNQKAKIKRVRQKYKTKEPYLVYLGTLQPRKNLVRLVKAFSEIRDTGYMLVMAGMTREGRGGWMYEDVFGEVRKLGLESVVKFPGFIPDEEVPYLLAGAAAYVLPSLYEGFGIVPIEAMATGVPVVVSNVSSLPEICGEAAVYIRDVYRVADVTGAIKQVINMGPGERQNRVEAGLEWVKRYNWKETAKRTLEVLAEVK